MVHVRYSIKCEELILSIKKSKSFYVKHKIEAKFTVNQSFTHFVLKEDLQTSNKKLNNSYFVQMHSRKLLGNIFS